MLGVSARFADSELAATVEVWVMIIKASDKKGFIRTPSLPQNPGLRPGRPPLPGKPATPPSSKLNVVNTADHSTVRVSDVKITPTPDEETGMQSSSSDSSSEGAATTRSVGVAEPSPKQESSGKINILLIPSIVIVSSLIISAIIAYLFRKKLCKKRHKISKDDLVSGHIL